MTKKGKLILGNCGKNRGNPKKQSSKFHGGLFCKSRPKVMAKSKMHQIKNPTPLSLIQLLMTRIFAFLVRDHIFTRKALLIWMKKISQRIPPGVLNMFWILWTITDYTWMKILLLEVCQPGGAAIIFPKSARNQNSTPLLL